MKSQSTPVAFSALVGRTIVEVQIRSFDNGRGGLAYDPHLVLDNGAVVSFDVKETESGEYGVDITVTR